MIQHISGIVTVSGDGRIAQTTADRHDVHALIASSWPGVGRCDSCGRIVVRGMGRWWDRGQWR
jgi:hypothetical protein